MLGTVRDVTEHHRDRAELTFLAEHDPLTGVANRRRIGSRIADCAADPRGGALLMIDIDNFKDINDLRGHAVGDLIIRQGRRRRRRARSGRTPCWAGSAATSSR